MKNMEPIRAVRKAIINGSCGVSVQSSPPMSGIGIALPPFRRQEVVRRR